MANVASSPSRCANLAKYLVALSRAADTNTSTRPSPKRRRLHILYLLSDALHHAAQASHRHCAESWASHLVTLVALAASFERSPKHKAKLADLVSLWDEKQYFPPDIITHFRDAVSNNGQVTTAAAQTDADAAALKISKDTPFTLPSFHGDTSTPWYDLPVGTWLPHLTPNAARPMAPDRIRPIQLAAGAADPVLISAVQTLLRSADRLYLNTPVDDDEDVPVDDINELGERFELDEVTGDVLRADTYYGWSLPFCEKMKARRKQPPRSRSRSRSSSPASHDRRRSESFSPSRKRPRRYSSSSSSSSRSRSRTPPPRSHNRERDSSPGYNRPPQHLPASHGPPPGALNFPPPPPPPAGFPGQWPPPPPPPPGGMPSWPADPAVMGQMMASWSANGLPPPPPPPPGMPPPHAQGYQQDTYNYQGGGGYNGYQNNNQRRGGFNNFNNRGRGRGR